MAGKWASVLEGDRLLPFYHLVVLALVQGITEFLPISSSGHLVIVTKVLGEQDQGLVIDIALHFGTLLAVMVYFWRDVWEMIGGLGRLLTGHWTPGARLVVYIGISTVPLGLAAFLMRDWVESSLRSVEVIAWATIGFGILLWLADRLGMTIRRIEHLTAGNALILGLAQVLALVPGTSRSGITMTAGRLLGLERSEAARFSLLMSIPAILGIALLQGLEIYEAGDLQLAGEVAIATALAFVAALIAIAVMMRWLRHASFTPFVIYRLFLGGLLLYWVYSGSVPNA